MNDVSRLKNFIVKLNSQMSIDYEKIKEIFNSPYGHNALDPLRDEICKCYICGLYQATITLTNHFLEKSLKYCLGLKYSIENIKDGMEIQNVFIDGINKYDIYNLGRSIEEAFLQGLITEEQKQELKGFKDEFRNSYSHANKKTLNDTTVRAQQIPIYNLENNFEDFCKQCFDMSLDNEIPAENLPFVQGDLQSAIAKEKCYPYFESVDKIVRSMLKKQKNKVS
ncbi:MAG: hypothetical protein KBB44_07330 [Bacteroidaceae bacterium]|nr:hypothetical protein [Bacteroidaceae bacterium]